MRKQKLSVHPPSLLIGILIGAVALLILLAAVPAPRAGATSSVQPQASLDKAASQVKVTWTHIMAGLKTNNLSASARRSCLQFRSWFNLQDSKLVGFLALHGMHLPRWQLPLKACTSVSG